MEVIKDVTRTLARYVVGAKPEDVPAAARREAVQFDRKLGRLCRRWLRAYTTVDVSAYRL